MKITCLLENTSISQRLEARHGLSLFIETATTRILFDMGPDRAFIRNATHLGIDLSLTDLCILSHGHSDHGGGIPAFQRLCPGVDIFMAPEALGRFFSKNQETGTREIGLPAMDRSACRPVSKDRLLSEDLFLFRDFEKTGFLPMWNRTLYREDGSGDLVPDAFSHELALLIREGDRHVLITGCAHSGVTNMVKTVLGRTGLNTIDLVIGGFHLSNSRTGGTEPKERLEILARELSAFEDTLFYTGHCTGETAFAHLKNRLNDQIRPLSTGIVIPA